MPLLISTCPDATRLWVLKINTISLTRCHWSKMYSFAIIYRLWNIVFRNVNDWTVYTETYVNLGCHFWPFYSPYQFSNVASKNGFEAILAHIRHLGTVSIVVWIVCFVETIQNVQRVFFSTPWNNLTGKSVTQNEICIAGPCNT